MSALRAESRLHTASVHRESNQDLLRRLVGDLLLLWSHEIALAKAEMKQHVEAFARTTILFVGGSVFVMTGILLLANAAALGVGRALDSLIAGYVIVGAAIVFIGAIVVAVAKSRLAKQPLAPAQALDEIRRDARWMTHAETKQNG